MARAVVVPAAGRQLREAGQRPALPGDPCHAWMGSEPLPAARDPTPKPLASSHPAWPAQGVVPAAGRQLREAGQRPALPGDPRCTGMGSEPLPAARDPTPKPSASSHLAWPAQGVVPAAGRQLREAGQRPALPGSTPCVDGVRALACGKGSDPKAIGLIPSGMAGTGGSAGRWPAIAGSRPAAGSTRIHAMRGWGLTPPGAGTPRRPLVGPGGNPAIDHTPVRSGTRAVPASPRPLPPPAAAGCAPAR